MLDNFDLIRDLLQPAPSEWQTMDSAPRDRRRIIGANSLCVGGDMYFGIGGWRWSSGGDELVPSTLQPTHWMPLPSPPTGEKSC